MVIDLGDGTPGVNQKGLISSRAQQERLEYQRILSQAFPAATKFYLWGDHDVGYRDFLWKIVESKITRESFQIAREILGPAWSSAVVGDFRFVFLNSEVTRNSPKPFLSKLRKEQQHFLEDTLKYAKRKVIIAIHDPFQIETFREILNRYLSKIELTLAGHFHLRIGKLLKLGKRKINLKIIPSPWGLALPWKTIGQGGFAILQLSSNSFSLEYQNL